MDEFDQVENKKDFRKIIFIIVGVIVVAGGVTAFLLFRKGSKDNFNSDTQNKSTQSVQNNKEKQLLSQDLKTWKNYFWPGKINTHYPSDWIFRENIGKDGLVAGINIVPSTGNAEDTIFIGGELLKCSDVLKYSKNNCLKNKIQVPFYTNSKNEEVLNAFDLIYQNSVLLEEEK